MKEKHLIVITGPTAVGKTKFTLDLAEHHGLEILSCDSRQFYREMSIGTAKPSARELSRVKHHFVDSLGVQEDYSAGDFERDGLSFLGQFFKSKDNIIMSGGSGLYIKAVCEGFDKFPEVSKATFDEISSFQLEKLQSDLEAVDPDYHKVVDLSNKHRLVRALAVQRESGKSFSTFLGRATSERSFKTTYIVLNRDREELYKRINLRVDAMMDAGLLEEVKSMLPFRKLNALQTVGYKELFDHLEGKQSLAEAVELIKRNSRRYAKRQLTWFRKLDEAIWLHPDEQIDLNDLIK